MNERDDGSQNVKDRIELSSARRIKAALIALGVVAALGVVYFSIRNSLVREAAEIVETGTQTQVKSVPQEILWFELERLPAELVGEDGKVIGSIFIDLRLAVRGTTDQAYLSQHLHDVRMAILKALASAGVGRAEAPLEIDYERVAAMILSAANQALDRPVVQEVSIPEMPADG
jgi:flagellar basal body-associated protein FliL